MNDVPRSPILVVSLKYHCCDEKNHDRMLLPIVEPMDNASKRQNKNTIWILTWRSTAVRLMGAALDEG